MGSECKRARAHRREKTLQRLEQLADDLSHHLAEMKQLSDAVKSASKESAQMRQEWFTKNVQRELALGRAARLKVLDLEAALSAADQARDDSIVTAVRDERKTLRRMGAALGINVDLANGLVFKQLPSQEESLE